MICAMIWNRHWGIIKAQLDRMGLTFVGHSARVTGFGRCNQSLYKSDLRWGMQFLSTTWMPEAP
jgi:hypothetical protein